MKTRLLKICRKRYRIDFYPTQCKLYNELINCQCVVVIDSYNEYRTRLIEIASGSPRKSSSWAKSRKAAEYEAITLLQEWIREDYAAHARRKMRSEKVWHRKPNRNKN